MKKLFVHQPLFRIFSPVFSGVIVYLLVLLINNNIGQIQEQFLGEDLYIFIALSYVIQESVRLLLWLLRRKKIAPNSVLEIITQIVLSVLLCIVIVTLTMTNVYKYLVGYSANFEELLVFNSIFVVISLIYVLLFVSHQYLYKINTEKLTYEKLIRQNIEDDFLQFKRDVNPQLLFDSLESLLILIEKNKEDSEEFIDHLSIIYRYILSKKDKQLVSVHDELKVSKELEAIIKELPVKSINLVSNIVSEFLIVPGSILLLLELISRTTINSNNSLEISLKEKEEDFIISYVMNDKLQTEFNLELISQLNQVYGVYSDRNIQIKTRDNIREVVIPRLVIS